LAALDVPSLIEQGLDVQLENWRAVVAPPGLSDAGRRALTAVVARMAQSESWRATLTRLGWTDSYLAGSEFGEFLDDERVRVARIVSQLRGAGGGTNAARVGEWMFPVLVLAGGASVLMLVLRRRTVAPARPAKRSAVVGVVVGLVSFVALLNAAGFVAAGTVLFACTGAAFGSRRWLRDALVGLALCAIVYVTFTRGLGVPLPPGAFLTAR
jgi:hypothetical protein